MRIKTKIFGFAVVLALLLCACSGKQVGTELPEQTLNIGEEGAGEESAGKKIEYFEEADCLPVPSSLYPEIFSLGSCDEDDTLTIYAYSMPTNDSKAAAEYYKKYLYYLKDQGEFGFVDATKELKSNGVYLTYKGQCVAITALSQSDDETCYQLCIAFGSDFDKMFNLYHGDESSSSSESPTSGTTTLSQGSYSVPEDISAGVYDIEIGSSEEHALSSVYYYKNGKAKGIYAINGDRGYNGLKLEAGDSLEISGDSIILKRR
jgi:hypothetical protein